VALPEALVVTARVAELIERLGVPYLVGGSLASSLHGIPRATQDADLVASLTLAHVEPLCSDLEADFYVDREMARREEHVVSEEPVLRLCFASAEDVILQKLSWFRDGGGVSERQWLDAVGVLRVQAARLESAYLRRWAAHLGVTDLLESAVREAGAAAGGP
jgi:hypothetical protein